VQKSSVRRGANADGGADKGTRVQDDPANHRPS
jgi:hypothetical protein